MLLLLLLSLTVFAQQQEIPVSDDAAWAVILDHSLPEPTVERRHAKIGLSPEDHAIYDQAMDDIENQRRSSRDTYAYLMKKLSPDGQTKLNQFIQKYNQILSAHQREIPVPDDQAARAVFSVHSHYSQVERNGSVTDLTSVVEKGHARIGFSAADHAIYDQAMSDIRNKNRKIGDTYAWLMANLSAEGQDKLNQFIQKEKRMMRSIIQTPIPEE